MLCPVGSSLLHFGIMSWLLGWALWRLFWHHQCCVLVLLCVQSVYKNGLGEDGDLRGTLREVAQSRGKTCQFQALECNFSVSASGMMEQAGDLLGGNGGIGWNLGSSINSAAFVLS